jgi:Barstar (barnase inhibitor)
MSPEELAFSPVNCVAQADLVPLRDALDGGGFAVLTLDGKPVRDKESLLAQAEIDLPPVEGMRPVNWDALADYLWNVLAELHAEQVALVWTDADQIVHGDLQDLLDALRVFAGVADGVQDGTGGFPRPTTFLIFLVGEGPEFRRLH